MNIMTVTIEKIQKLERVVGFLSDIKNDDLEITVVNENGQVDTVNSELLQELRELNSRRELILSKLSK